VEYKLDRLKPGAKYVAQIRSLNDEETSEWSPGFYITTPVDTTIPANLGTVTATYVNGAFKYAWPAVVYNVDGTAIKDLDVYVVTISDGTNSFVETTETLSFVVDQSTYSGKLGSGPTVSCSVKARDYSANQSVTASSASLTAPVTSTVTGFTATGTQGQISLKWTAVTNVPVLKYEIYAGDTSGFTPDTTTFTNLVTSTSSTDAIWSAGTTVVTSKYFKIRAVSIYSIPSAAFTSANSSTSFVDTPRDSTDINTTLGAIGFWKLDELSGTTATDSGINLNNGTYTNGVLLNQTKVFPNASAKSAYFDGTDDHVVISTTNYQALTSAWSVTAVVKPGLTTEQVILTHTYAGGGIPFIIATGGASTSTTAGKFIVGFYNGSWRAVNSTTSFVTGQAYVVTGTWDGTNLKIYINGLLEATAAPGSSPTSATASSIYIGRRWDSAASNYFNGNISDVSIYGRCLSATEASAIYDVISGSSGGGAITVKDEGTTLTAAATTINFVGAGVTSTNVGPSVTVTVPGGGGHVIYEETTALSPRSKLRFLGPSTAVDNSGNDSTDVTVVGVFSQASAPSSPAVGAMWYDNDAPDIAATDAVVSFGPNSQALTATYATITYVTTLTTGSWLVQIDADGIIYTGYMPWKTGSVTGNAFSELLLTRASLTTPSQTITARIYGDNTDNTQKFQLAATGSFTVTNLYLTFRKLI
jgi:hypothetical protein